MHLVEATDSFIRMHRQQVFEAMKIMGGSGLQQRREVTWRIRFLPQTG